MAQQTDEYLSFATWRDVLVHVQASKPIFYQAPLDFRPVRVRVLLHRHARRGTQGIVLSATVLRVYPPTNDADPFFADARHLDRFRQQVTA